MLPIRILYLQPAAAFGGAERQAVYHIARLPMHGVEVVPVVGPGPAIVDALSAEGVRDFVFRSDLPFDPKAPRSLAERGLLYLRYARSCLRMARELDEEARDRGCRLIFASRPFAWVVSALRGGNARTPVVWRAGTLFEHWAQPAALAWLGSRHPPRAVIYASRAVREALGVRIQAPGFVVHNGVDPERFSAKRGVASLRDELGIPWHAPVVAVVGRISPEKGHGQLVTLCRHLRSSVPELRVLIAGDSGWRARFSDACHAAGLDGVVQVLGFVRDVERVYATADVVVSPSLSEGCPNAVMEAMAMGRAVVATRVGGTGEIIRDGLDGLLVAPGDVSSLSRRIAGLLREPPWREELGRGAAARVRSMFSLNEQIARLAGVLRWAAGTDVEWGGRQAA